MSTLNLADRISLGVSEKAEQNLSPLCFFHENKNVQIIVKLMSSFYLKLPGPFTYLLF